MEESLKKQVKLMASINSSKNKIEFGDFQTPDELANLICEVIQEKYNYSPDCIIEPTCGKGNILVSAIKKFPSSKLNIGIEINDEYLNELNEKIQNENLNINLLNKDFFSIDLRNELEIENGKILFIGNPPWVTNSILGKIESVNLPKKNNFKNFRGIEAITGKSNFDLSEFILIKLIDLFFNKNSIFAFLIKTSVARKILISLEKNNIQLETAEIFPIDSKKYFDVSVDACLFILKFSEIQNKVFCNIYESIDKRILTNKIGFFRETIIQNTNTFLNVEKFLGTSEYVWRNGIKHDQANVMELNLKDNLFLNSRGEIIDIEKDLVFPLLKSSDLAKGNLSPRKGVIITQKRIGENTNYIKESFPKTWNYLNANKESFMNRKSSIYKNKPLFSIFSIGDYSFYPYKIAISGLYKNIKFNILNPHLNKSIQVDDTCNFISCKSLDEAEILCKILNSSITNKILSSLIFWDSKRPITTEILNKIDLKKIAKELNYLTEYNSFVSNNPSSKVFEDNLVLF